MKKADLVVALADADATCALGALLATALLPEGLFPALLLQGPLGSGKTTLVHGLVQAMPGGETAEVSSPSFNLANLYPTRPEIAHLDLYRLDGLGVDESMLELLDAGHYWVLIEWIEHLPARYWPEASLCLQWLPCPQGRLVSLHANGKSGIASLETLRPRLEAGLKTTERKNG